MCNPSSFNDAKRFTVMLAALWVHRSALSSMLSSALSKTFKCWCLAGIMSAKLTMEHLVEKSSPESLWLFLWDPERLYKTILLMSVWTHTANTRSISNNQWKSLINSSLRQLTSPSLSSSGFENFEKLLSGAHWMVGAPPSVLFPL